MNYFTLSMAVVLLGCMSGAWAHGAGADIIPRPAEAKELPGEFTLTSKTTITIDANATDVKDTAQQLADLLDKPLGAEFAIKTGDAPGGSILLTKKDADTSLGDEGYLLSVHPDSIVIRAATATGLFYGIQSLRQLLPPQIEKREKVNDVAWTIPCVEIKDSPRYPWRGLMLDVARHFFDKVEVEHVLDLMALHKFNRFHWHLTDDQGWRIEIKKYPKLTEIGAWRDGIAFNLDPKRSKHYRADGKYGGFYTTDDIREVVAYAAKLHIMVIPEIEMPGHSQAALAAYPEFSCSKKATTVGTKAGVMDAVYDPAVEGTFTFLDGVLGEVAELFPAPYIHVGTDEVPKEPWKQTPDAQELMKQKGLKNEDELQSYFVKRMVQIVESKHKKLIGWDEILEGGLAPGVTVMSWRGTKGGTDAALAGHDVIMSPTSNCYFDYSQTKRKGGHPTIGGYLPLATVYAYEPTPTALTQDQARHVLGSQGNLWTEYVPNMQQAEYQLFPRACAMAEVTWSTKDRRDYTDFQRRLEAHTKRLDALGVNYFKEAALGSSSGDPIGTWAPNQMSEKFSALSWDAGKAVAKPGKYRVVMEYTGGTCRLDIAWVALQADGVEISRDTHDGRTGGADSDNSYVLNVPVFKEGAKITLVAQVRSDGGTDSNGTVTVVVAP